MSQIRATKFLLIFYVLFVSMLVLFDINDTTNLNIPNPPDLTYEAIFNSELGDSIDVMRQSNPVLWVVGTLLQAGIFLIAIVVFFMNAVFFVLQMFVFIIPGQDFINYILIFTRIIIMLEIVVYIKNMFHPSAQATG